MSENKKHRNTQVPAECLKKEGPSQEAKYSIKMLSSQKILEELMGEWEQYKIEITNKSARDVVSSKDLMDGLVSKLKAYDGGKPDQTIQKDEGQVLRR